MIAFVPSTMVMFQAFGGLAVAMPADACPDEMVLVNATVLVLGQPLMTPVFRRFGAAPTTVVAILAMSVGIASQAVWPYAVAWTILWTLGELVVVIVSGRTHHRRDPDGDGRGLHRPLPGGAGARGGRLPCTPGRSWPAADSPPS